MAEWDVPKFVPESLNCSSLLLTFFRLTLCLSRPVKNTCSFYIQSFSLTECIVIVGVRKTGGCLCVCLCVCVSVCLCVCWSIISKSYRPILMKLGRMMYNDNISLPFEDEINRIDRTQTSPKRVIKIDIKATFI